MKARYPNNEEMAHIGNELDYFGVSKDMHKEEIIVLEGAYTEFFLTGAVMAEHVLAIGLVPQYAGVKIGELKKGKMRSSLEWGTIIFGQATKNKVDVTGKAASLFLYGHDVFKEHLTLPMPLGRKLVGNGNGEFMGFGIYNGQMLANVIDKGAYLRKYE